MKHCTISLMDPLSTRISRANSLLSPCAVPHDALLGRVLNEPPDETRFPFQRDRDRIIHTQAFRRLKGKTQVFVSTVDDHIRTRLTHTMEVTQISRDMARTLSLNEDLAECIALAHDLGHPPFGHAGEDAMNEMMQLHGGSFEHNLQSLHIVTLLETRSNRYAGLNLNREVLEGLMKHRTAFDTQNKYAIPRAPSLEAQVVNLADEIAYVAHDVEDGLRAGILAREKLHTIPLFSEANTHSSERGTDVRGGIIHLLVTDAYGETERLLKQNAAQSLIDVYAASTDLVAFSQTIREKLDALREYLFEHFYQSEAVMQHSRRGQEIIRTLFAAYENHPPKKVLDMQQSTKGSLPEAIKDYIAGMTDTYATRQQCNE